MNLHSAHHDAEYDEEGNIILPSDQPETDEEIHTHWNVVRRSQTRVRRQVNNGEESESFATMTLSETIQQYQWAVQKCKRMINSLLKGSLRIISSCGALCLQPVWVLRPDRKPKKYRRSTLFVIDTIRFGTTFASIFVLLFVGLNAHSFWEIAQEKINPIQHAQAVKEQSNTLNATLKENLLKSPFLATAGQQGNVLSVLPNVGPPENRIIIPKLGLNIPLMTPSYEALLREDWNQVEVDIQDALQYGVVHYPGTARPGQAGNFFVTGHSSYYPWAEGKYKSVFARLHNLDVGDEYIVYYGGDQYKYVVKEKKEVKPDNVDVLAQPVNNRISTLMTCTPVGTTLRRLILVSQEVDPLTGLAMEVGKQHVKNSEKVIPEMLPI